VDPRIVIIYVVLFLMLNGLAVKLVHFFIVVIVSLYITIIKQNNWNYQIF